jgi:diguanylate cyclase (GGDEF)-like protein
MVSSQLFGLWRRLSLPGGVVGLEDERWHRRHTRVLTVCWLHVVGAVVFALVRGYPFLHAINDAAAIAVPAGIATWSRPRRRLRSTAATLSLVIASSVLVHLSGGLIEMHFHYFVMVGVIGLYQDPMMFAAGFAFVVGDHGLATVVARQSVYNHTSALEHPWTWALVHGGFYLAACITNLVSWWQIEYAAAHDPLTQLPNRAVFARRLRTATRGSDVSAVFFVDLDGFKAVNDGLGHHIGDQLLAAVAGRLRTVVRDGDIVARLGGDEFAILLQSVGDSTAVDRAAHRVLGCFTEPFLASSMPVRVSASIGVATDQGGHVVFADLLRQADVAMRAAKHAGRGCYRVFERELHGGALDRAALLADLGVAVRSGGIDVHYQPIVDLATGDVLGVEALARWDHPLQGAIPPSIFIKLAEESGLIGEIGIHVLRTACLDATDWPANGDGTAPYLSVNLSPWQFHEPDVASRVLEILDDTGLAPCQLVLEITETALMDATDATMTVLQQLRTHGVRFAIDDFGTGYSSLGYLRSFPVDVLKIDQSFVADVDGDVNESALVHAIIRLGNSLGLTVVAEGVERDSQAARLRAFGCRVGQGHLFAAPNDRAWVAGFLTREEPAAQH